MLKHNLRWMQTIKILEEISKLPKAPRLYVVEKTMNSIRLEEEKNQLTKAAILLLSEYEENEELTIFTQLDLEGFYETR